MIHNKNGFTQTLLLTLLPIMVGILSIVFSVAGLVQFNMRIHSSCRTEQIKTQVEVREILLKLLAKNPRAVQLRTQLLNAQAQLVIASASLNAPVIAMLNARIQYLQFQRLTLDIYQKSLIQAANATLAKKSAEIFTRLTRDLRTSQMLNPLFHIQSFAKPPQTLRLAVVPRYPDLAPPYETMPAFPVQQSLVQKWHYQIRTREWLNHFVKLESNFEKLCSTTIEEKEQKWAITTKEDKS